MKSKIFLIISKEIINNIKVKISSYFSCFHNRNSVWSEKTKPEHEYIPCFWTRGSHYTDQVRPVINSSQTAWLLPSRQSSLSASAGIIRFVKVLHVFLFWKSYNNPHSDRGLTLHFHFLNDFKSKKLCEFLMDSMYTCTCRIRGKLYIFTYMLFLQAYFWWIEKSQYSIF